MTNLNIESTLSLIRILDTKIFACNYDGAETRIDRYVIAMWSYPDVSSVNANKTTNANDNFAPQELAQAA